MSANVPASVAMDQARELTALRHEVAYSRALIREAQAACGDYLKAPHDDLVGAIKDMRQEILLVRTALNQAAEDVARQRGGR